MVEAEAVAQLRHPNVVQVYEVAASTPGRPYLTMEYVEDGTLADRLAAGTHFTPKTAARTPGRPAGRRRSRPRQFFFFTGAGSST